MGLFIIIVFVGVGMGVLFSLVFDDWGVLWCWTIPCSLLAIIVCSIVMIVSWDSAVDQHKRIASFEQYASRLQVYTEKANVEFKSQAITDLKYQEYQSQLGEMITELSKIVIRYNQCQVGKKIYDDNLMFFGLISYDESLPANLRMEDYLK